MFYVLFLFEDFDMTTTRSLAIHICICLNHWELSSFAACLSFCWLEEMKLSSVIKHWPNGVGSRELCLQRLDTHDQITRLIFLCQFLASFSFLTKCNSSQLETSLRFCMEMFKYSEFDVERKTAKSTIMFTFFSISALDRRCPSPQSRKHCI